MSLYEATSQMRFLAIQKKWVLVKAHQHTWQKQTNKQTTTMHLSNWTLCVNHKKNVVLNFLCLSLLFMFLNLWDWECKDLPRQVRVVCADARGHKARRMWEDLIADIPTISSYLWLPVAYWGELIGTNACCGSCRKAGRYKWECRNTTEIQRAK